MYYDNSPCCLDGPRNTNIFWTEISWKLQATTIGIKFSIKSDGSNVFIFFFTREITFLERSRTPSSALNHQPVNYTSFKAEDSSFKPILFCNNIRRRRKTSRSWQLHECPVSLRCFFIYYNLHMSSSETDGRFQIYSFFFLPMTNTSFVLRKTIHLFSFR